MNPVLYDVSTAPWDIGQMMLYVGLLIGSVTVLYFVQRIGRPQPGASRPGAFWAIGGFALLLAAISIAGAIQCTWRTYNCLNARDSDHATTFAGTIDSVTKVRGTSTKSRARLRVQIGEHVFISALGRDISECGFIESFGTTTNAQVGITVTGIASGQKVLLMKHSP